MGTTSYAIALGSNRHHGRHGAPAEVVAAAMDTLGEAGLPIVARSTIRATPAMGGAGRSFANAAVLVDTNFAPHELLTLLKAMERAFGRRTGRRWGARVLDLDILLCSRAGGSPVRTRRLGPRLRGGTSLVIPHPGLTMRAFVLEPLVEIAPRWRHPASGLTVRQLRARLRRAMPVDRSRPRP